MYHDDGDNDVLDDLENPKVRLGRTVIVGIPGGENDRGDRVNGNATRIVRLG